MAGSTRRDAGADSVDLVRLLRRWWRVLLVAGVAGAAAGVLAAGTVAPIYEVKLQLLVGPVVADADVLEGSADLARTYGEILESRQLIRSAAAEAGIAPGGVSVRAFAERGSSALTVIVHSPVRGATPVLADALVQQLRDLVTDARPDLTDLPPEVAEAADLTELFPSGSELVVIDDGGQGVTDRSLGKPIAAAAGTMTALMLAAGAALAWEQRPSGEDPRDRAIRLVGDDLAEVVLAAPLVRRFGSRLHVLTGRDARDRAAAASARVVPDLPYRQVVFVAAPSEDDRYLEALVQLAAGTTAATRIVDPDRVLASAVSPTMVLRGSVHALRVGGVPVAELLVPRRRDILALRRKDRVEEVLDRLAGDSDVVLVYLPVGHRHMHWRDWASVADQAVILAQHHHLDDLDEVVLELRASRPRLLGVVRVVASRFGWRTAGVDVVPQGSASRAETPAPAPDALAR